MSNQQTTDKDSRLPEAKPKKEWNTPALIKLDLRATRAQGDQDGPDNNYS